MGYFFAAIAVIGSGGVSLVAPLLLVGRTWPRARRLGARLFRRGVAFLLRCQPWLRADVDIRALPPVRRGTLYVSNHRSTLDVFFLLAHIDGIRILAKRSLVFVPFLGEVMLLTRQVLVSKSNAGDYLKAMRKIERGLRAGESLHVFPEYTRCPTGFQGTQKFAAAPFHIARATNARVVPIVFENTDQAWPKGRYGLRFRSPVRVRSLPAIEASSYPTPLALAKEVRARIDAALGVGFAS